MAVDPALDRVFFLNNLFGGGLGAVETVNASSTRYVSLEYPYFAANWGWSTTALAFDGAAHTLFVTDSNGTSSFLTALDPRTGNLTGWVPVGIDPVGVVVDSRTGDLWVANGSPAVLTEIQP